MGKNVWGLYVCFLKSKSIHAKKYPRLPYLPLPPFFNCRRKQSSQGSFTVAIDHKYLKGIANYFYQICCQ